MSDKDCKDLDKQKAMTCSNPECEGYFTATTATREEDEFDSPEVAELRKMKNEYYKKFEECDNKINQIIAESHEVEDYTGKWIKISRNRQIDILHVTGVEKKSYGLLVKNDATIVSNDNVNNGIRAVYLMNNSSDSIIWSEVNKTQVLTDAEADVLDRLVFKVKNTIDDIATTQHI